MTALGALYIFVFLGLFSPGPNVILLTASGARFGFKRTIPHILGVALGVGITSAITGLGIGAVILQYPQLRLVLSIVAALWIGYMALRLWRAATPQHVAVGQPFTFFQAVLFQWINPKVWAVAVAAMAYLPNETPPINAAVALGHAFAGLNLVVCLFWACFGHILAHLLNAPARYRIFMRIMAIFLLISIAMIFV